MKRRAVALLLALLGWLSAGWAGAPEGDGWVACATSGSNCTPATGSAYEVAVFKHDECSSEGYFEGPYIYRAGVAFDHALPGCWSEAQQTYYSVDPAGEVWRRELTITVGSGGGGDPEEPELMTPEDALAASWLVVASWAAVFGVRFLGRALRPPE